MDSGAVKLLAIVGKGNKRLMNEKSKHEITQTESFPDSLAFWQVSSKSEGCKWQTNTFVSGNESLVSDLQCTCWLFAMQHKYVSCRIRALMNTTLCWAKEWRQKYMYVSLKTTAHDADSNPKANMGWAWGAGCGGETFVPDVWSQSPKLGQCPPPTWKMFERLLWETKQFLEWTAPFSSQNTVPGFCLNFVRKRK